jgi:SAM-dependent methyltransferase
MRLLDRVLQQWRFRRARPWVPAGAHVLDIGCHQGEFLTSLADRIGFGVGFDPLAVAAPSISRVAPHRRPFRLVAEAFPVPSGFADESFDAVVLLATLEHILDKDRLPRELFRLLRPDGRVILTLPSPRVDAVIDVLRRLHLADGMSVEQHHGFAPEGVLQLFAADAFVLEHRSKFQAGLNNLFVFRKPDRTAEPSEAPAHDGVLCPDHGGATGAPNTSTALAELRRRPA